MDPDNRSYYDHIQNDTLCIDIDRVALGGCFAKWEYYVFDGINDLDTIVVWESCGDEVCCWESLKVCYSLDGGSITIETSNQYFAGDTCDLKYIINPRGQFECIRACDWNANLNGYYPIVQDTTIFPKLSYDNYDLIYAKNSFGIKVNKFENYINYQIKVNQSLNCSIKFYDLIGNLVDIANINCISGINTYKYDLINKLNGIYIYIIEIDGLIVKTDKFIK